MAVPASRTLTPENNAPIDSEGEKTSKVVDDNNTASPEGNVDAEKQPAPAHPGLDDFPDGGWEAWGTVAGAWLVLFCTFGYVNAWGVYQEYYQLHYLPEKTSMDIAWIGSFQLFLQFASGTVTGKLFDEGYYRYLLTIGSFIYVLCLQMVSLAKSYYSIFLAQGLGLGIGNGILFLPAIGAVSHHFKRRRALATGIVVSGSSIGGICFPIMLNRLFENTGFGWGVRASGFLILGLLVVANPLIKTRLPPRKQRPAHLQQPPDMKGIITDVPYVITVIGLFFIVQGLFYPIFYLQLFASVHGVGENLSFYSLAILNAASVFGRVIPNFIADIYGPLNLLIPCVGISTALMWILLACGNKAGVITYAIFFGFFSGAYISILPSALASFARSIQEIGVRMGLPFALIAVGALIGTPITGELVGSGPEYYWWKGSTYAGVVCSVGLFFVIIGRFMQAARKGTQRV